MAETNPAAALQGATNSPPFGSSSSWGDGDAMKMGVVVAPVGRGYFSVETNYTISQLRQHSGRVGWFGGNEIRFAVGGSPNNFSNSLLSGDLQLTLFGRTTDNGGLGQYMGGDIGGGLSVYPLRDDEKHLLRITALPVNFGARGGLDVNVFTETGQEVGNSIFYDPAISALYLYVPAGVGVSARGQLECGILDRYDTPLGGEGNLKHRTLTAELEVLWALFMKSNDMWLKGLVLYGGYRHQQVDIDAAGIVPVHQSINTFLLGVRYNPSFNMHLEWQQASFGPH